MTQITVNVEESDDKKKLVVGGNYYDLDVIDREELLNLLIKWSEKELITLYNIKKNSSAL